MAIIEEDGIDEVRRRNTVHRDANLRSPPVPSNIRQDSVFECSEPHDGFREFFNIVVDMHPEAVFNFIFNNESFIQDIYTNRKYTELSYTPWEKSESGVEIRQMTYRAALPKIAVGATTALVIETQTISNTSCQPHLYVINSEANQKEIPYAEYFKTVVHYCIERKAPDPTTATVGRPSAPQCRVKYFAQVKFRKNPVFFVKNMIERSAMAGLELITTDIAAGLEQEAERVNEVSGGGLNFLKALSIRMSKQFKGKRTPTDDSAHDDMNKGVSNNKCGWFILIMLLVVACVNVFLFTKLSLLDDLFRHKMYLHSAERENSLKKGSFSHHHANENHHEPLSTIIQSLKKQEMLLQKHSSNWKEHLGKAVTNLKEVEDTLEDMITSLPSYIEEHHRLLTLSSAQQSSQDLKKSSENFRKSSIAEAEDDHRQHAELLQNLLKPNKNNFNDMEKSQNIKTVNDIPVQ